MREVITTKQSQITHWCHSIIQSQIQPGGAYVDATMGNGRDTLFLCGLAGTAGRVWAFDIQDAALAATKKLLEKHGYAQNVSLIKDGHENMDCYLASDSADAICFNFGYLPGGDHGISTKADTSLIAIQKGLDILKSGGMMSLCVYSGGDTGFEERECILGFLKKLPADKYTVILNEYYNRRNHPPLPVFVFKE